MKASRTIDNVYIIGYEYLFSKAEAFQIQGSVHCFPKTSSTNPILLISENPPFSFTLILHPSPSTVLSLRGISLIRRTPAHRSFVLSPLKISSLQVQVPTSIFSFCGILYHPSLALTKFGYPALLPYIVSQRLELLPTAPSPFFIQVVLPFQKKILLKGTIRTELIPLGFGEMDPPLAREGKFRASTAYANMRRFGVLEDLPRL